MSDGINVELLIELVSQHPCIWDKELKGYHSRSVTTEAWRKVCAELNEQFNDLRDKEKYSFEKAVLKKWRNIRDQWLKTTKKVDSHKKSGDSVIKWCRPYIYNEQLSFLTKTTALKEESSQPDDSESPPSSPADNNTPGPSKRKTKAAPTPAEGVRKVGKVDIDKQTVLYTVKDEDPKVMFYKGILPNMTDFDDDENLQFQSGVLNLIQKIKKQRSFDTT